MNWFKKEDPKETMKKVKRETKREVRSNQRDLDRELRELDRLEIQTTLELKQRAKKASSNKDPALAALAKQLVNVRNQKTQLQTTRAQLGAMGMHATVTASHVAASTALGNVTKGMQAANQVMSLKQTTQIMAEFTREQERLNVKEDMMEDALASAFDNDEMDAEADTITAQVLAELGVEMDAHMVGLRVPTQLGKEANASENSEFDTVLPDLKARLDAL